MNTHSLCGLFLLHVTLFVPLPPGCSVRVFILLPYCPIHLPGFMSLPYSSYPILISLHCQLLPLLLSLVLIQAFFSLPWLHANLFAILLYLSLFPLAHSPDLPFSISVLFPHCVTFFFHFLFLLSLSLPTSWLLATSLFFPFTSFISCCWFQSLVFYPCSILFFPLHSFHLAASLIPTTYFS